MLKLIIFISFLSLLIIIPLNTFAIQDNTKTGINFGVLPTITYDSDFGLQYGGMINLFFFGDGSSYPKYRHSIYSEISRFTKGSGVNRLFYDSYYLIPNIRVTGEINYLTEQALPFYGFNGAKATYNPIWEDDKKSEYKSRVFYRHERKMFKFKIDFQSKFAETKFGWVAGYETYNFKIGSVNINKLNKGKSKNQKLPDTASLYDLYTQWGVISDKEKNGGRHHYAKVGIIYDNRDNEPNPMKGIWSEFIIQAAPSFMGTKGFGHTKISLIHRQYFTIIPQNLSFAVRFQYQTTLGKCPFYLYPIITNSFYKGSQNEGLGGAKTVRGILRNRLVGKSIVFSNAEFRYKIWRFHFLNQNFYAGVNLFMDAGAVTEDIPFDKAAVIATASNDPNFEYNDYFKSKEKVHIGYGAGLTVAMNQNFIGAINIAQSLEKDSKLSIYIGLNYLF